VYPRHKTRVVAATNTGWYADLNTPDDLRRYGISSGQKKSGDEKMKQSHRHVSQ
jgi:hypothetical protein